MRLLKYVLSYFPSKVPTGMTAYRKWQEEIIALVGPIADERSLRWAIANMVMHAPSDGAFLSKQYFVKRLIKTAANQLSAQVFQDIKAEQEAEQQAAQLASVTKQAEATAEPQVASNETKEISSSES